MITESKLKIYQERIIFNRKPITAQLSITRKCNLKCSYCFHRNGIKDNDYMAYILFDLVLKRLIKLQVRGLVFSGQGEPGLNPDFYKIIGRLHNEKINYGINSNLVKYIEPRGASWLKINIDSVDKKQYKTIKGADYFDKVVFNLKKLIKANLKTKIVLQCLAQYPGMASEFYDYFKKYDIDCISIRPIDSVTNHYKKNELQEIKKELKKLADLEDRKLNVSFKWNYLFNKYEQCYANWTTIAIRHDGTVSYCCSMWEKVVGSIFDIDILNKKEKMDFNKIKKNCPSPCRLSGLNDYIKNYRIIDDAEFC